MIYVHTDPATGLSRAILAGSDEHRDPDIYRKAESRWDWNSYERAVEVAAKLNADAEAVGALDEQGHVATYIAVDQGSGCSPRYDVIAGWYVGEKVSKGFNGDYYPVGTIVKMSADQRIITVQSDNPEVPLRKFWRRKLTSCWLLTGGTWRLVSGVHNDKNPSF